MVDNICCNIAQSAHANQLLRFVFSRTSFLQSKTISLFNSATLQKYSGTSRGLPVFDSFANLVKQGEQKALLLQLRHFLISFLLIFLKALSFSELNQISAQDFSLMFPQIYDCQPAQG